MIICLVKATYRDLFASLCVLNDLGPTIFRMFFTFSTGPLAISIALFRNSLVFHSFDHMCILAVHIGPPLTLYGMRWYAEDLEKSWPDTFHINCSSSSCPATTTDLLWTPFGAYLVFWWIPYSLLLFVFLSDYIKKEGHVTMYSYYEATLFPKG